MTRGRKILGSSFGKLNYVDGFAGLGAYTRDDKIFYGSPVIAAEVIKRNNQFVKQASLILIDSNKKTFENLNAVLKYKGLDNCPNIRVQVFNEDFNEAINGILKKTENQNLAPTFVFIDPFGFEGIHYDTIQNIMKTIDKPEIVINFMYNAITRFLEKKELEETFTRVFGTDEWKEVAKKDDEREKNIVDFYVSRLKKISKFVFPYRLTFPDKKRTYYYLIHMTNHYKGATIMKSSFAKYSFGKPEWLGENSSQTSLADILGIKPNEIKNHLIKKYDQKNASFLEIIEENIDTTPYLDSQLRHAIQELEKEGIVYVERFPRVGRRTGITEKDLIYFNSFPSIERKSLLYETKVEYGNFTINHVSGCSHGCNYPCYAFMMAKSYGKVKDYEDWIHPKIVSNALELLEKEIPKYKDSIDFVHLSFTTDPFMYDSINKRVFPAIKDLTLKIIEKLNSHGIKVTVLTKGIYPGELGDKKRFSADNEYGVTLVSLKDKFKSAYEPFAAPLGERIKSLELLHKNGFKTWVSIEPYPTPNISKQEFDDLLKEVCFVDKLIFGKMNYNPESTKFPNNQEFYRDCSMKLINFCSERKIQFHIKEGTPCSGDKTKGLFKG